jgi:hypothetical protein
MPYTAPTVNYSATINGTYTTLTGVQSVSISRGRQRPQDPFQPSTMVVELIPANSYSVPLAVGQCIDVRPTNSAATDDAYFAGRITDIERTYDFPYNSGTGAAPSDRIVITALGPTGTLGLETFTNFSWPAGTSLDNAILVSGNANVLLFGSAVPQNTARTSAQTYTGSALDALNKLATTGQFFFSDNDGQRNALYPNNYLWGSNPGYSPTFTFRDTAGSGYRFNRLEYLTSIQNTFTQVQINAEGLAPQEAETGSAPYNTLVQYSYNETTSDALALANYLLNISTQTTPVPFTVSSNTAVDSAIMALGVMNDVNLGTFVNIIFRGSTVTACLQGINLMFTPQMGTVQCYFSPTLGQPFILNSASNGVLDQNRLGYS